MYKLLLANKIITDMKILSHGIQEQENSAFRKLINIRYQ